MSCLTNWLKGLVSYIILSFRGKYYLGDCKYRYLWYLSFFSKKHFLRIKTNIISSNKERLKQKGICKVGFIVYTTSMWSVDGLYQKMEKDECYDASVIVTPFSDATEKVYNATKKYFIDKNYKVETPEDESFDVNSYDLLLYTNPYISIDKYLNIFSLNLNTLVSYVSYSYMLADNAEKLNMPIYLLSWQFFCDSEYYKQFIEKNSRIYSNNAVFCGYPKMDSFYLIPNVIDAPSKKKTIIYAPHHSVNREDVKAATFEENGWFFLYLAEKYKDKLFWIVKPHPLLRTHSVESGIFSSEEQYDSYLNRWVDTGSAIVVETGDYFESFKQSDAMVTDSVSFLAEYQFTGKPLLLLESGRQTYNSFGESIKQILYRCKGNDFETIISFLNDILADNDTMKEYRKVFFASNLIPKDGDVYANNNIYALMKKEVL